MLRMRYTVLIGSLVFYAAVALSQSSPGRSAERTSLKVKALDINLGGYDCKNVSEVWVVMDGDENGVFPANSKPNDPCHWTAPTQSFDTAFSRFSLRLGIARTICAYSDPDRQNEAGKLRFECCRTPARKIAVSTISNKDEIPFSYTREVPENADGKHSPACTELYSFAGRQEVPILSVWFPPDALSEDSNEAKRSRTALPPAENLRLQLGLEKADPSAPGLLVNDLSVMKLLHHHGDGRLSVSDLRDAFQVQLSHGLASAPPGFSADGYLKDLEEKRGLKSVRITLAK